MPSAHNKRNTNVYLFYFSFFLFFFAFCFIFIYPPFPPAFIRYHSRFPFSSPRPTHRCIYTIYTLPRRHCRCPARMYCGGGGGLRIHTRRTLHIYAYISYVRRRNDNIFICTHVIIIYIYGNRPDKKKKKLERARIPYVVL